MSVIEKNTKFYYYDLEYLARGVGENRTFSSEKKNNVGSLCLTKNQHEGYAS